MTAVVAVAAIGLAGSAGAATTTRVSLSSSGAESDVLKGSFGGSISSDGRFVAFISTTTNFDAERADTNGQRDVFVRDRKLGETRRISVSNAGAESNGGTLETARISADGRFVAFVSNATTLDPGATAGVPRLYRYDRVTDTLQLVPLPAGSTSIAGTNPGSQFWWPISISADGSRIAFRAVAAGISQVWWWDSAGGAVHRGSETAGGTAGGGGGSWDATLSGDGRFLAFTSASKDLGPVANPTKLDTYVKNLQTGAVERISTVPGVDPNANGDSWAQGLSYDGCYVAFFSDATNFVASDVSPPKAFGVDRCGGGQPAPLSVEGNGITRIPSMRPVTISDNGCKIVFLAAGGNSAQMRDRCKGTTTALDVPASGNAASVGGLRDAAISPATGRYVAFTTTSDELEPGTPDSNAAYDVFVRTLDDNTPPVPALTTSVSGVDVTADGTGSSDPDGYTLTGSINWGDGIVDAGLIGVHRYARAGTFGVTLTVTDADGIARNAIQTITVGDPPAAGPGDGTGETTGPNGELTGDRVQLILDRVALSRSRLVPGAKVDASHGATLALRLNASATVTVTVDRAVRGRKVKGVCRQGARKGARCTAYKRAGVISRRLQAGSARIAVSGTFRRKRLAKGTHRLTVRARGADGQVTAAKTLTFTVTAAKPKRR